MNVSQFVDRLDEIPFVTNVKVRRFDYIENEPTKVDIRIEASVAYGDKSEKLSISECFSMQEFLALADFLAEKFNDDIMRMYWEWCSEKKRELSIMSGLGSS